MRTHLFKVNNLTYAYDYDSNHMFSLNDLSKTIIESYLDNNKENDSVYDYNEERVDKAKQIIDKTIILGLINNNSKNWIYANPEFRSGIQSVTIVLTKKCNLACEYCYESDLKNNKFITDKTVDNLVEFLEVYGDYKNGVNIVFFGGEPLLFPEKIKCIIEKFNRSKLKHIISYSLTTNGTIFNEKVEQLLSDNKITVTISFDGTKKAQNKYRKTKDNKETSDILFENYLKFTDSLGYKPVLRVTITEKNIHINEIAETVAKMKGQNVVTNIVSTNNLNHQLNKKWLAKFDENIEDYINNFQKDKVEVYFNSFMKYKNIINQQTRYCGEGVTSICIDEKGNIFSCHRMIGDEKYKFGNINISTQKEIMYMMKNYVKNTSIFQYDECRYCWAAKICLGGCRHENEKLSSNEEYLKALCKHRRREIEISVSYYIEEILKSACIKPNNSNSFNQRYIPLHIL